MLFVATRSLWRDTQPVARAPPDCCVIGGIKNNMCVPYINVIYKYFELCSVDLEWILGGSCVDLGWILSGSLEDLLWIADIGWILDGSF